MQASVPWTPTSLAAAAARLSALHPTLARLHATHGLPVERLLPVPAEHHFGTLARAIVGQQVSGKAAASIHARVVAATGGGARGGSGGGGAALLTAAAVAATPLEDLRSAGLSGRKVTYLSSLAAAFSPGGSLAGVDLQALDDDSLTSALTALPGIGPWSAHMFAMFALGRTDVLPTGDLGIRKGVAAVFREQQQKKNSGRGRGSGAALPSSAEMEALTAEWAPHRSLACWWLWRLVGEEEAAGAKKKART